MYEEYFELASKDFLHSLSSRPGFHPFLPLAYYDILEYLHTTRYLNLRWCIPFSAELREDILPQYSSDKFRRILRLTPPQLNRLVELIQNSKDPARHQAPVKTQLIVALYRVGTKRTLNS